MQGQTRASESESLCVWERGGRDKERDGKKFDFFDVS